MSSYDNLLARVQRMIDDALRRHRLPATQIDGQITITNMPPGTTVPDPAGGGTLRVTAETLYALLSEGVGIDITLTSPTVTIASTGGGGGPSIVFDNAGNIVYDAGGDIVTSLGV